MQEVVLKMKILQEEVTSSTEKSFLKITSSYRNMLFNTSSAGQAKPYNLGE